MSGLVSPAACPQPRLDAGARLAVAVLLSAVGPAAANGHATAHSQSRLESGGAARGESVAFAISMLVFLLAFCVFSVVVVPKRFGWAPRRGQRAAAAEQRQARRDKNAVTSEEILERLPPAKMLRNSNGDGQPSCTVCLCEVDVDEDSITTQCGHIFHKDCVLRWWTHKPRSSVRCPTCRTKQKIRVRSRDGNPPSSRAHPEVRSEGRGDESGRSLTTPPAAAGQESGLPDLEAGRRTAHCEELPVRSPHSAAPTDLTRVSAAGGATPASQVSAPPPSRPPPATGGAEAAECV